MSLLVRPSFAPLCKVHELLMSTIMWSNGCCSAKANWVQHLSKKPKARINRTFTMPCFCLRRLAHKFGPTVYITAYIGPHFCARMSGTLPYGHSWNVAIHGNVDTSLSPNVLPYICINETPQNFHPNNTLNMVVNLTMWTVNEHLWYNTMHTQFFFHHSTCGHSSYIDLLFQVPQICLWMYLRPYLSRKPTPSFYCKQARFAMGRRGWSVLQTKF